MRGGEGKKSKRREKIFNNSINIWSRRQRKAEEAEKNMKANEWVGERGHREQVECILKGYLIKTSYKYESTFSTHVSLTFVLVDIYMNIHGDGKSREKKIPSSGLLWQPSMNIHIIIKFLIHGDRTK